MSVEDDISIPYCLVPEGNSLEGEEWADAILRDLPIIPEECRARLAAWFEAFQLSVYLADRS